jgi:O-antigen/teichoic acid export membrane protein
MRMLQFGRSRRDRTILDQIIVSGSNFITGIILVRGLGLHEFGQFTVAYAFLLLANSVQLSFISSPMITLASLCSTEGERRRFVRGMFGVLLIFCAITASATVATGITYIALHGDPALARIIPAFSASVVLYVAQDWLRRYYFTAGKAAASIWNDSISYLGQVLLLCLLLWLHRLTIESAFWTIALTSGIAFASGAILERMGCTFDETRDAFQQSRRSSIDLGISNQLQWLVYQGAMLVGASVAGAQAAGGVRATQNVVGPVNVVYQAMENIVPIRAAEEMRRGGAQSAAAFLFRFGFAGFVVLLVAFSAVSLFSDSFLVFFYGRQLRAYAGVLNLQLLYFLLAWPVRQFTFLFRTIKNTTPILISSIVAALISLSFVYPMVHTFGALGIVIAAVAGQTGNLLYLIFAWMRLTRRADAEPRDSYRLKTDFRL